MPSVDKSMVFAEITSEEAATVSGGVGDISDQYSSGATTTSTSENNKKKKKSPVGNQSDSTSGIGLPPAIPTGPSL